VCVCVCVNSLLMMRPFPVVLMSRPLFLRVPPARKAARAAAPSAPRRPSNSMVLSSNMVGLFDFQGKFVHGNTAG
jgi:hypothetical protein